MDVDILKPDTGYLSVIERPTTNPGTASTSKVTSQHQSPVGSNSPVVENYAEPESEGEEDDDMLSPAKDEDKRTGLTGEEVQAAVAYREQMLKDRKESPKTESESTSMSVEGPGPSSEEGQTQLKPRYRRARKTSASDNVNPRTLSIDPLAPSSAFDETLKTKLSGERAARQRIENGNSNEPRDDGDENGRGDAEDEEMGRQNGNDRILTRDWHAPDGKRISVPVRIEPKVYFAAERTFLVCFPFFRLHYP